MIYIYIALPDLPMKTYASKQCATCVTLIVGPRKSKGSNVSIDVTL